MGADMIEDINDCFRIIALNSFQQLAGMGLLSEKPLIGNNIGDQTSQYIPSCRDENFVRLNYNLTSKYAESDYQNEYTLEASDRHGKSKIEVDKGGKCCLT